MNDTTDMVFSTTMQPIRDPEPPTSATRQVWADPELVGMILSHLEPREIMVCKRIDRITRDVINKNTNTDVGRKIWTLPTGTRRKIWLVAQAYRHSLGSIRQISEAGEEARKACKGGETLSEPVVANPLLVETTVEREMAVSREKYIKRAQQGQPHKCDVNMLAEWLWSVRPNQHFWTMAAMSHSASTLQDPLWLDGKSSTANMQLFDPPIYGTMKTTCKSWEGRIMIDVIPTPGSESSITWGAVGKAYKRVIDQYTKRQLRQHGNIYNHTETKTPMSLCVRVPRSYALVPQDLYWWFRDLLKIYHRLNFQSFVDRPVEGIARPGKTDRMGSTNDTFEIANAGYNVPSAIPLVFKTYLEQAKAEDRKILGKPN